MKKLLILCKVVDNFGDIGVVYRLCRAISEQNDEYKISLVVSCLDSFSKMADEIDPSLEHQVFLGMDVYDWNASDLCKKQFESDVPEYILECFQCGRPDWLEEIIFHPDFNKVVKIINVEYLTAESWADECHLLKSGTRSANVKKMNFFPGFTNKTGGLILDENFISCRNDRFYSLKLAEESLGKSFMDFIHLDDENHFNILLFSYPMDFSFLVKALNGMSLKKKVSVFVANGAGKESFMKVSSLLEKNISLVELPYIPQKVWDALLTLMDFAFIRGEDSFSRSCLIGKSFAWNIYPQDEEYHFVKLIAFLERMKPFFSESCFSLIREFFVLYNFDLSRTLGDDALDALTGFDFPKSREEHLSRMEKLCLGMFNANPDLDSMFFDFSESILQNGNLAVNLLDFMKTY